MKILQVNKFYYQGENAGGTGRYFFNLINLLENYGHQIQIFSTKDRRNASSSYSSYFIEKQDFANPKINTQSLKKALGFIYSFEAKKKIAKLIQDEKPDIVHIHNIYHHITPSILPVLKKANLPIIQTLHDFHLISPNYNLYAKNKTHESCSHGHYWKAIFHKCIKDSYSASLLMVLKMYFEKITKIYLKNVDYFIAPSRFLRDKYIENGFPAAKIIFLPPFINISQFAPRFSPGKYILYFGRLHPQKGVRLLVDAVAGLPQVKLKIVGSGEEKQELTRLIKEKKLENVKLLGEKSSAILKKIISQSAFVIVPSLSYENAPLAVLEAFASGKPVIASNLGGLPELIQDQKTGLLFRPGDKKDLKRQILNLYSRPILIRNMGLAARLLIEKEFSPVKHYQALIRVYRRAKMRIHEAQEEL